MDRKLYKTKKGPIFIIKYYKKLQFYAWNYFFFNVLKKNFVHNYLILLNIYKYYAYFIQIEKFFKVNE